MRSAQEGYDGGVVEPVARWTMAYGTWPRSSSGTPTTKHDNTSGCAHNAAFDLGRVDVAAADGEHVNPAVVEV